MFTLRNLTLIGALTSTLIACGGSEGNLEAESDPVATDSASLTLDCGKIKPGQHLGNGQILRNCSGTAYLYLQPDGNLVLYTAAGRYVWDSATWAQSVHSYTMQWDGSLVLYRTDYSPAWARYTGVSGATFNLTNSGNLTITSPSGGILWQSNTSVPATAVCRVQGTRYRSVIQKNGFCERTDLVPVDDAYPWAGLDRDSCTNWCAINQPISLCSPYSTCTSSYQSN